MNEVSYLLSKDRIILFDTYLKKWKEKTSNFYVRNVHEKSINFFSNLTNRKYSWTRCLKVQI